jgi:hypothetical protein
LLAKIVPIDENIVDMALSSKFNDFEDGLQYYAAKERKACLRFAVSRRLGLRNG